MLQIATCAEKQTGALLEVSYRVNNNHIDHSVDLR
jgi:hypothetical protein